MSGRAIRVDVAEVFSPLLTPARYKASYGGRGSGKSQFFAGEIVKDAIRFPGEAGEGLRGLCVREIQKSLKQSAKRLIEKKLIDYGLTEADGFKVFESVIQTPGDGVLEFQGMQDHTAESVKSFEGFHRAWMEEAQSISATSLNLLRPTIRWEDKHRGLKSEIWASWNPRRKADPVDVMFRGGAAPTDSIVVRANWNDNPWFPDVLETERQDCLRINPEQYGHIWNGEYATVLEGAYFAKVIAEAREQGRIGRVGADPLMTYRLFCDIGGTGAKADAFAIWVAQFIGREIRVLDHYEAVGQPLAAHVAWMRSKGYTPEKAQIWLPHDGVANDKVFSVSYESELNRAGYSVTVIPNQGAGAAKQRIEAVRMRFPACWFNESTTSGGIDALGWYHEKKDTARNIGLGPDHDWSSHSADAFGLMCVAYEEQKLPDNGVNYAARADWF